jgi:hypothetical protein
MKKLITLSLALAFVFPLFAQDSTKVTTPASTPAPAPAAGKTSKKNEWTKALSQRHGNDHFLLQIGYNGWAGIPDTVNTKGIPRSFNAYFMFDFPFKTSPQFSVGIGLGLGTDNFYLNRTSVDIAGLTHNTLSFRSDTASSYFKKYKVATTYLEIPVELRFTADPSKPNKSWKGAIGGKVGTMLSAMTKGKTLLSSTGGTINNYTEKVKSKRFFNSTRLAVEGRISKGIFGIYGQYQINNFVKDGAGPDIRPFQIGITISGL